MLQAADQRVWSRQQVQDRVAELDGVQVQQIGTATDTKCEYEIITTETNQIVVGFSLPADNKTTAAMLQDELRRQANKQGDRRMQRATIEQQDDGFVLRTSQASRARVRSVLNAALLAGLSVDSSDDDTVVARLPGAWDSTLTADTLQEKLRIKARQLGEEDMDELTVRDEQGQLVVTVEQADEKRVRSVLSAVLLEGVAPEAQDFKTEKLVTDAIRQALQDQLSAQNDLDAAVTVKPITEELLTAQPYVPQTLKGGVLLRASFGPGKTETSGQIEKRFAAFVGKEDAQDQYGNNAYVVLADESVGKDELVSGVEIAVVSPDMTYMDRDSENWNQKVWQAFVDNEAARFSAALSQSEPLPWVTQVDPSVGRKSMNDALVAIAFSLAAIVIYIWVRFGTVRFGVAAVVALVHDVSIAVGMVAASAWLSQTWIGEKLLISEFKINLPMIAAFLTVIGYSLNDTIVVFDRIRENRGKLAVLSPDVINLSINQVISRTILTSFTTLIVLVVMYIWGGPGLRGFNYVLIIGVLVGTYSSIGIATPLLYGAHVASGPNRKTAARTAPVAK